MFAFVGGRSKPSLGGVFNGRGEGVYAFRTDEDGPFELVDTAPVPDPTFLAISQTRRTLYAGSHSVMFEGKPGGGVTSFRINEDGSLSYINSHRVEFPHVTMVGLDEQETFLFAASSLGGAVNLFPIEPDGALAERTDWARFDGDVVISVGETPEPKWFPGMLKGTTITRLPTYGETTIPHCARSTRDGRWVLVADIGTSTIYGLRLDATRRKFTARTEFKMRKLAGPRILSIHPDGRIFFSINELDCTVSTFEIDGSTGMIAELAYCKSLPDEPKVPTRGTGIALHPSGRFLWTSHRGHNSISTFLVGDDSRLDLTDNIPANGDGPNHLALTPDGKRLFSSNMYSNSLSEFSVDQETGLLSGGQSFNVPASCCVFIGDTRPPE
jgi:6-phosphogluconolactonase